MLGEKKVITGRYYNSNNQACAIVAVITQGIDWSAYINGVNANWSEDHAVSWVADYGAKLSEKDARHYFPDIELPYRS